MVHWGGLDRHPAAPVGLAGTCPSDGMPPIAPSPRGAMTASQEIVFSVDHPREIPRMLRIPKLAQSRRLLMS